jgi:hypothetical protein
MVPSNNCFTATMANDRENYKRRSLNHCHTNELINASLIMHSNLKCKQGQTGVMVGE